MQFASLTNSATQVVQAGTLQPSDVTPTVTVTLHVSQNVTFTYSVS